MNFILGATLFSVLLLLSIIHIYWGLGGKWGTVAAIPTKSDNEKIINPGLFSCLVVASSLLAAGIFILIRAGFFSFNLPHWLMAYGLWIISIIFLLRALGNFTYVGLFKKIKTTPFGRMDTKYFTPLCLLIGFLVIILELIT